MGHAVTWGSLFGIGFIVAGIALFCFGALAILAGGMSDAPQAVVIAALGAILAFISDSRSH